MHSHQLSRAFVNSHALSSTLIHSHQLLCPAAPMHFISSFLRFINPHAFSSPFIHSHDSYCHKHLRAFIVAFIVTQFTLVDSCLVFSLSLFDSDKTILFTVLFHSWFRLNLRVSHQSGRASVQAVDSGFRKTKQVPFGCCRHPDRRSSQQGVYQSIVSPA